MITTIIGIDCATDAKNTGLARASFHGDNLAVLEAECGETQSDLLKLLTRWVETEDRVLLALDAPLGWPEALGRALIGHSAGALIEEAPDQLFRRLTDRAITERCKKRPLDVGADRIARTAHAALKLLGDLRRSIQQPVPLAWSADFPQRVAAIEVYPAATLTARRIRCSLYKKQEHLDVRQDIVDQLSRHLHFSIDTSRLVRDADILDAVVCVLAGSDFLREDVLRPGDERRARREGWIWSKIPSTGT